MDRGAGGGDILQCKDINKMREGTTGVEVMENGVVEQVGVQGEFVNKENSEGGAKAVRRPIKNLITDKPFRIRSYLRRRPVPLKRCLELDVQCATKSFHLQINADIDEAVYCGAADMLALFLSPEGLRLSEVCRLLEAGGGGEGGAEAEEDPNDEDFYDSIKSRNKREKEVRAESARRMAEVEYLQSPLERAKRFKSSKEGIFAKICEIESVCCVVSLTVIANPEKELCAYSGDPGLITDFFTRGVSRWGCTPPHLHTSTPPHLHTSTPPQLHNSTTPGLRLFDGVRQGESREERGGAEDQVPGLHHRVERRGLLTIRLLTPGGQTENKIN